MGRTMSGLMRLMGGATLVAGLTAFPAHPVAAQEPTGLFVVLGLGYEDGGPGESLLEGLTASGYHDDKTEPPEQFPFHFDEGLDIAGFAGVRYRFSMPLSVDLVASNGPRGHAEGYNDAAKKLLVLSYSTFHLTATAGAHLGPFRVGAGPVLSQTAWETRVNTNEVANATTRALGLAGEIGGNLLVREALLSLKAGFRMFPESKLQVSIDASPTYSTLYLVLNVLPIGR